MRLVEKKVMEEIGGKLVKNRGKLKRANERRCKRVWKKVLMGF
jgi:hypothetical protein